MALIVVAVVLVQLTLILQAQARRIRTLEDRLVAMRTILREMPGFAESLAVARRTLAKALESEENGGEPWC